MCEIVGLFIKTEDMELLLYSKVQDKWSEVYILKLSDGECRVYEINSIQLDLQSANTQSCVTAFLIFYPTSSDIPDFLSNII